MSPNKNRSSRPKKVAGLSPIQSALKVAEARKVRSWRYEKPRATAPVVNPYTIINGVPHKMKDGVLVPLTTVQNYLEAKI